MIGRAGFSSFFLMKIVVYFQNICGTKTDLNLWQKWGMTATAPGIRA